MSNKDIHDLFGDHVATVKFNDPPSLLRTKRVAFGFVVEIPITIHFSQLKPSRQYLEPLLSNLWGEITGTNDEGKSFIVGKIMQPEFQIEHRLYQEGVRSSIKWIGNFADLALFEKVRQGNKPRIDLSIHGEISYLVQASDLPRVKLRTESRAFWLTTTIEFPIDIWIENLRAIGIHENILIEVPLPNSPPSPWDDVWKALIEARQSFEQGGATAWKNCIVSTRLALEKWQKIEKEDMGAGWTSPSPADRQARTKEQRLDNIRWHILQYAHYSAHSHADNWTRDDALLMLTTLSSLLAKRNP
jgi:hypothetical protein